MAKQVKEWQKALDEHIAKLTAAEKNATGTTGSVTIDGFATLTALVAAMPKSERREEASKIGVAYMRALDDARSEIFNTTPRPDNKLAREARRVAGALRLSAKSWHASAYDIMGKLNKTVPLSFSAITLLADWMRDDCDALPTLAEMNAQRLLLVTKKREGRSGGGTREANAGDRLSTLLTAFSDYRSVWRAQLTVEMRPQMERALQEIEKVSAMWNKAVAEEARAAKKAAEAEKRAAAKAKAK